MLLGLYICTIRARVSILQLGSRARFSSLSIFFSLSLLPTSWSPALLSTVTAGHNSPGRRPSRTLCRGRLLLSVPGWPPTTQDTCPAAISISPLSPGSYLLAADHSLPQVGPLLCRGRLPPTASRPLCRGCLLLSVLGWPPTTHGPCPACLDRCRPAAIWISPPSPGSFLLAADLPLPQAGPLLYCGRPPLTASRPSRPPSSPPVPAPLARRLRFPRRLLLRPWRLSLMAPPPPSPTMGDAHTPPHLGMHACCPTALPPSSSRPAPPTSTAPARPLVRAQHQWRHLLQLFLQAWQLSTPPSLVWAWTPMSLLLCVLSSSIPSLSCLLLSLVSIMRQARFTSPWAACLSPVCGPPASPRPQPLWLPVSQRRGHPQQRRNHTPDVLSPAPLVACSFSAAASLTSPAVPSTSLPPFPCPVCVLLDGQLVQGTFVSFDWALNPILRDCVEIHPQADRHVPGLLVFPRAVIASLVVETLLSPSPPTSLVGAPPLALSSHHVPSPPPSPTNWVVDSGASFHTTPTTSSLFHYHPPHPSHPSSIVVANDSTLPGTSVGASVLPGPFYLNNVLVAPHLTHPLLSVRRFTSDASLVTTTIL
jgi:hypothetical protein